jgi:hypothetical protein
VHEYSDLGWLDAAEKPRALHIDNPLAVTNFGGTAVTTDHLHKGVLRNATQNSARKFL